MAILLAESGISGWERDDSLPGKPDFVWKGARVALFVDGCFWHGHVGSCFRKPASNAEYWERKVKTNIRRDTQVRAELERNSWRVLQIWECELNDARVTEGLVGFIKKQIDFLG